MGGMLALCLAGALAAGMPAQGTHGVLFALAGLLMIFCPPVARIPWPCWAGAAVMLAAGAGALLPAEWFAAPGWRADLEALGLPLGRHVTPAPWITLECLGAGALALAGALFMLGHRLEDRDFPWLALCFAGAVAVYAAAAIVAAHQPAPAGAGATVFGFFPNRNHTATFLVMGSVAGAGILWQGIRHSRGALAAGAVVCVLLCLWALIGYNISRAGVILLGAGTLAWWAGLGRAYFSKWALLVLALGAAGLGWIWTQSDSALKSRLNETAGRLTQTLTAAPAEEASEASSTDALNAAGRPKLLSDVSFDLRQLIYRDVWRMIRAEPWTGVGLGNFHHIFPQYRQASSTYDEALHPESDWWWWAAEIGWAAPLLAGGCVLLFGLMAVRRGRGKWLWMGRMACLAAALVVPLHGVFDVPGHRLPLFWAAVWLAAAALRPVPADPSARAFTRWAFRLAGVCALAAGAWLMKAEWLGGQPLAMARPGLHTQRALALYTQETAPPPSPAPAQPAPPTEGEDPLYVAYLEMGHAIAAQPLDAYAHYLRGALALYFKGLEKEAAQDLALQRRLEPLRPETPFFQAALLAPGQPGSVPALWEEGLGRLQRLALARPSQAPHVSRQVAESMRQQMRAHASLERAAIKAISSQPSWPQQADFMESWSRAASAPSLDEAMPGLLLMENIPLDRRQAWWKIWAARGSKEHALRFAAEHADFAPLSQP